MYYRQLFYEEDVYRLPKKLSNKTITTERSVRSMEGNLLQATLSSYCRWGGPKS